MITFRKKKYLAQNLMPDALEYLKKQGLRPNIISPEEAILLAYRLISDEIERSDSAVKRNLIKFKS